jgi:hypothetical protein
MPRWHQDPFFVSKLFTLFFLLLGITKHCRLNCFCWLLYTYAHIYTNKNCVSLHHCCKEQEKWEARQNSLREERWIAHGWRKRKNNAGEQQGTSNHPGAHLGAKERKIMTERPKWRWTNQKNTGWTSVDRSTKATLSTYNTWIQISRLQKVYRIQSLKLWLAAEPLTVDTVHMQQGRDLMLVM